LIFPQKLLRNFEISLPRFSLEKKKAFRIFTENAVQSIRHEIVPDGFLFSFVRSVKSFCGLGKRKTMYFQEKAPPCPEKRG